MAAAAGDAFVRWDCDPRPRLDAWLDPDTGAVAYARTSHRWGRSLVAVGPPPDAARLAAHLLAETGLPAVTVSRGGEPSAPAVGDDAWSAALGLTRLDDWDWMWTDVAPPGPVPGEERVLPLSAAGPDGPDTDDVRELLAVASPRHSAGPGDPLVRGWVGVREERSGEPSGRLIACAAWEERVPGVPHLASIAALPHLRGQGLGTAVTAALTRRLLAAGSPVVTLALYADNHAARRLYLRLGYRLAQRLVSWARP